MKTWCLCKNAKHFSCFNFWEAAVFHCFTVHKHQSSRLSLIEEFPSWALPVCGIFNIQNGGFWCLERVASLVEMLSDIANTKSELKYGLQMFFGWNLWNCWKPWLLFSWFSESDDARRSSNMPIFLGILYLYLTFCLFLFWKTPENNKLLHTIYIAVCTKI